MGAKSRRKGASGEREVVAIAREEGFASAVRTAPMQAGHSLAYEDVAEVGRLAIEAKRYKRTPVNRFARVTLAKERPGFISVLAYRDDHQSEPFAVVKLRDLLRLERQALAAPPPGGGWWQAVEDADREDADAVRSGEREIPT